MQNDKMSEEMVVIAINRIKMRGTKLVEATTQGKEATQEQDRKGDPEVGLTRIQTTPKCIEMITFIPLKDSGLIIKTPFRRREDVETNEDKEVAFVRIQLQEIEIIRFMHLRKGTLAVKAIFSPKWDVEVKAAEGVHQNRNQNRSERVVKAVKPPVLSMIRMQAVAGIHQNQNQNRSQRVVKEETFRRAISFQMLRIPLSSCKDNRTNEREEEEILMKIRCIQHP